MSTFNFGYGAILEGNATSSYVELANLIDISLPKVSIKDIDATTLGQSTNIMQYQAGMRENGKLTATALYVEAQYSTLRGQVGTAQSFKVTLPDTHTFVWSGYINEIGEAKVNNDKLIEYSISFTCNSDVTIT